VAFPAGLTLVTVNIRFDLLPDGGASGTVRISNERALLGAGDNSIVPFVDETVTLASDGTGSVAVPATNDPQWSPLNFEYDVSATIGSRVVRGTLQLDYQATSVQLADLLQIDGTAVAGTSYILTSQRSVASGVAGLDADGDVINAAGDKVGGGTASSTVVAETTYGAASAAGVASTYSRGDHTHGTPALGSTSTTAAAGNHTHTGVYDPAGTASTAITTHAGLADPHTQYALEADLGGAALLDVGATAGTVAAGDDARITGALQTATGGTVTGDLTVADDPTATKAYRFKVSGGSLDLDAAGEDLYLSAYPNADFTGTQRAYARYEAGTQLAHLLGRHLIAAGAFDATGVADLDPSTGVAAIGAKNSLTNVRVAGFKATAGAPSTGTWADGDVVLDSAGTWHLCTAGGTPGAWTTPSGGGASIVHAHGYVTSGNITPQNTGGAWAALTGGPTFTIAAAVDDEICFEWAGLSERNLSTFYDACVLVGGSPVRYASSGSGTAAVEGDPGYYPDVPSFLGHAGPFSFTAESGDISGGNVTIGFAVKSGGSGQLFASTSFPLRYTLTNYGGS
jgi:hypothetical protein